MNDPRYPNRPDHPDFWALSEIIIDQDSRAEAQSAPFEEMLARVVDAHSIMYMASQRALRAVGRGATNNQLAKVTGVWLDAFLAGAAFQAKKDRERHQH